MKTPGESKGVISMSYEDREYDKTHLSIDIAEQRGLIHRDYIAHCFRWSHVVKYLQRSGNYAKSVVLDPGCGREFPLAKTMYVNKMSPKYYLGVDMNRLEKPQMLENASNSKWFHFLGQADVTKLSIAGGKLVYDTGSKQTSVYGGRPNVVTSFEMLEHVHPRLARRTLEVIRQVMTGDGVAFISTPCFNGKAAGNHINEMTYTALGALIEDLDFEIQAHYGTFASIADYKDQLESDSTTVPNQSDLPLLTGVSVFNRLREYYDTNVLANIFAPLYPQFSRNCLWELRPGLESRKFPLLVDVPTPWSQHKDHLELAGTDRSPKTLAKLVRPKKKK